MYAVGGHLVRVQLVDRDSFTWPWRPTSLDQRFAGCPPATMNTFTSEGFAAAKTSAWCERNAPRDLYDLWALAVNGHLTPAAAEVFRRLGPTNTPPSPAIFPRRTTRRTRMEGCLGAPVHRGRGPNRGLSGSH